MFCKKRTNFRRMSTGFPTYYGLLLLSQPPNLLSYLHETVLLTVPVGLGVHQAPAHEPPAVRRETSSGAFPPRSQRLRPPRRSSRGRRPSRHDHHQQYERGHWDYAWVCFLVFLFTTNSYYPTISVLFLVCNRETLLFFQKYINPADESSALHPRIISCFAVLSSL